MIGSADEFRGCADLRRLLFLFGMLFIFWMVVTESLEWDSLLVGALVCLAVAWLNRDIMIQPADFPRLTRRRVRILLAHFAQLLVEVVKANIQVVRIVLSRHMEFDQGLVIFTPHLKYEWVEVLFANSITMTPGTVTVDLEEDVYTVHILDMVNADSLVSWNIQDRLRSLEEDE